MAYQPIKYSLSAIFPSSQPKWAQNRRRFTRDKSARNETDSSKVRSYPDFRSCRKSVWGGGGERICAAAATVEFSSSFFVIKSITLFSFAKNSSNQRSQGFDLSLSALISWFLQSIIGFLNNNNLHAIISILLIINLHRV